MMHILTEFCYLITVDRIEALHKKYPTNEEIAISFSCALANLSAKQNAIGATQTLEKIEALHTLFLKNKRVFTFR